MLNRTGEGTHFQPSPQTPEAENAEPGSVGTPPSIAAVGQRWPWGKGLIPVY